jgi:hypothetical protein
MKITIPETPSHIQLHHATNFIRSMGLVPTINRNGDLIGLTPQAAADLGRPAQRTANVTPIGRGRA